MDAPPTNQRVIPDDTQGSIGDFGLHICISVLRSMTQIDQQVSGLSVPEPVTVQTRPRCSRQFRLNSGILQQHPVIPGRSALVTVVEPRTVTAFWRLQASGLQAHGTRCGNNEHVQHVTDTRATQVGV